MPGNLKPEPVDAGASDDSTVIVATIKVARTHLNIHLPLHNEPPL